MDSTPMIKGIPTYFYTYMKTTWQGRKEQQFKILVAPKSDGQIIFSKHRNLDECWVLDFLNILIG